MQKYTRQNLYAFLAKNANDAKLLNIGGGKTIVKQWFPNSVNLDIDPDSGADIIGDACNMPVAGNSFDAVLCSELLEHVNDPRKVASEILRVLRPGGTLILTTRFCYPVHIPAHEGAGDYFRFSPQGLKELFNGFSIQSIEAECGPFMTIATLLQRIIFQTDVRGGKLTKGCIWLASMFFSKLDFLVSRQWNGIRREYPIDFFMSTGIYMIAKKR